MREYVKVAGAIATLWLAGVANIAGAHPGSSPGAPTFGTFGFSGPVENLELSNYDWEINDAGPSSTFPSAPGIPGPSPDANYQVSGWSLNKAIKVQHVHTSFTTPGDFYWDATPSDPLTIHLDTLLGPQSVVGAGLPGPMADFDPNLTYVWPVVTFQGAYKTNNTAAYPNGPPTDSATLDASTNFDLTDGVPGPFANPHPGTFGWLFDGVDKELDIVYQVAEKQAHSGVLERHRLFQIGRGGPARRPVILSAGVSGRLQLPQSHQVVGRGGDFQ